MASWPLEREGSTGEDVRTVQYLLNAHGAALAVDGDFGPRTKAAVENFQSAHGLAVDGIVGNQTWPALIIQVSWGITGDAVKAAQSQINSRTGYLAVDGIFGPKTDSAVRSFQGDLGLTVDGIVGPITWNHLVNGYIASTDAVSAGQGMFQAWTHNDQVTASPPAPQPAGRPATVSHVRRPLGGYERGPPGMTMAPRRRPLASTRMHRDRIRTPAGDQGQKGAAMTIEDQNMQLRWGL